MTTAPDAPVALRAVVHGRVQGVGFRWATRERLAALGLDGAATNRPDGTVEVVATGPRGAVDRLVAWLREGTTPGHVTRVDVDAGAG
ncbi:acylphosphatase [Cellulosimicrobium protaetiae]|uniref:acylphosphatase n=1 Tax=Cellulosimicrobium protaetiae TaxID=2587808 RepID=A0A6M5UJM5_9MICO|nr:acylphosphatase [Cellulosimicrobium protaetiae]QJW37421.1 acylphosphatase [Cellulosimicrobium protaetiae]